MLKEAKKVYDFLKNTKKKNPKDMSSEKGSGKKTNSVVQSNRIIRSHVIWAMAASFVPYADMVVVSAAQLDMIRQMCRVYDVPFEETQGKALISSLTSIALGKAGASGLARLIPGIGTAISGAIATFNGASTYALGEVFKKHFESGGTILDFDPARLKKYYKEKFEKGKTVTKKWKDEAEEKGKATTSDNGNFKVSVEEEVATPEVSVEEPVKEKPSTKKKPTVKVVEEKPTAKKKPTIKVVEEKAAAKEVKETASDVSKATDDIVEKLKKLSELKDAGIITAEEFGEMKKRILDKF